MADEKDERIKKLEAACASLRAERDEARAAHDETARGFNIYQRHVEAAGWGNCFLAEQARAEAAEASLWRETRALRALAENWRAKAERIAVNGKGTRVEDMLMNRATTFHECADELDAALASPSGGHSPNCAIWRGVSVHPESEPLPCDCALASPSGAQI